MRQQKKIVLIVVLLVITGGISYWVTNSQFIEKMIMRQPEKLKDYDWESTQGFEEIPLVKKMQEQGKAKCELYFKSLTQPIESSEEIINLICQGESGKEFKKKVDWYIHCGNSEVINAVIADLPNRCQVEFIEKQYEGGNSFQTIIKGQEIGTLDGCYGYNKTVGPFLHDALHKYAKEENKPSFIYLLLRNLGDPSFSEYYTDESVKQDILSYLQIYLNYKDCRIIRNIVTYRLEHDYWDGKWPWREACALADKEGLDSAFNFLKSQNFVR